MLSGIKYALNVFKNKKEWKQLMKNAMETDNSWNTSAKHYLDVYKELASQK
jgi:starch synthase